MCGENLQHYTQNGLVFSSQTCEVSRFTHLFYYKGSAGNQEVCNSQIWGNSQPGRMNNWAHKVSGCGSLLNMDARMVRDCSAGAEKVCNQWMKQTPVFGLWHMLLIESKRKAAISRARFEMSLLGCPLNSNGIRKAPAALLWSTGSQKRERYRLADGPLNIFS